MYNNPVRDAEILALAAVSPRAAWAEYTGAIKAPFVFSVGPVIFEDTTQQLASGDMDVEVLGAETWVKDIVFDIQVPAAFENSAFQSMSEFFFHKTSGLQVKMDITGRPRYDVCPNFAPLSSFANFIPGNWPQGWLLTKDNGIHVDMQPGSPIPSAFLPARIFVTFRAWQYVAPDIDAMSVGDAIAKLKGVGYDLSFRNGRTQY